MEKQIKINLHLNRITKHQNSKCSRTVIIFNSHFYLLKQQLPSPTKFLLLRFLNLTFMKNKVIGNFVKRILVKMLIINEKKVPVKLKRTIEIKNYEIKITDIITKRRGYDILKLSFGSPFTSIHMASSKYYPNNLLQKNIEFDKEEIDILNNSNFLRKVICLK